jgi:pimeloyl-ACP methyl ester carboxylesterase
MPYFDNKGIKIYYEIKGSGPDLIMIHGYTSSIKTNWAATKWIKELKNENKLILIDCRGHGKSSKPTEPSLYGSKMSEDIIKLIDHLSIQKANFFGYSMGSRLVLTLLLHSPSYFNSAILGGFAIPPESLTSYNVDTIINALRAKSIDDVQDPIGRAFRTAAELRGGNLEVLIAVMKGFRQMDKNPYTFKAFPIESLKKIRVPILTVVGSEDVIPGDKTLIAKIVPKACYFQIQGHSHVSVLTDDKFYMVVKSFLAYVNKKN